jgi:hypothetical protein
MLLTPLRKLDELTLRLDHLSEGVLLTFEPHDKVRTIASLWFDPNGIDFYTEAQRHFNKVSDLLLTASSEGRLWWGTVFPAQDGHALSICYYFAKSFPLPSDKVRNLALPNHPTDLETTLDLV